MNVRMSDLPAHIRAQIGQPARVAVRKSNDERSELEAEFAYQLRCQGTHFPAPVREHRFHPTRRWRFDFAWPDHMVAVEVEGQIWAQGRHTRGGGFVEDCTKYAEAVLAGWRVFRVTQEHLDSMQAMGWLERALFRTEQREEAE